MRTSTERDEAAQIQWLDAGMSTSVPFRMGRQGDFLIAEWRGIARLTCTSSGDDPRLSPLPGSDPRAVAKIRGLAKALVGDLQGDAGVHASAIEVDACAVLFIGASGQGKSTAAAEMCLHFGARLLADDAAVLRTQGDRVEVLPSEGTHYLTRESRAALGIAIRQTSGEPMKRGLQARAIGRRSFPLALVVALRFDDALSNTASRPLGGNDAALRMMSSLIRFEASPRRRDLDFVALVHSQAAFVEIARPVVAASVGRVVLESLVGGPS